MKYHSVGIFVTDIEVSRRFYTEVLGRQIEHDFGGNIILAGGISIWQIDANHILSRTLNTNAAANRFELYFETEDIQGVGSRLNEYGVRYLHDVIEEPWGQRTIRFFDPDGHLIEVGESMVTFIGRMHRQGMTVQQISLKTSISQEHVRGLIAG
jgi:catechol 2,3-dioxygenase-like lactoylglutathione lyase family enzyme